MWDRLSPLWKACLEEAWNAALAGCMPIGAVVAGPDGRILARGRNRIGQTSGSGATSQDGEVYGVALAHAELNALISVGRLNIDYHLCTLYTTMEPCPLCLGAWYMSGVRTLRFAARDPFGGSTSLVGATPYLSRKPVKVYGPGDAAFELLCEALAVAFMLEMEPARCQPVFDAVREVIPAAMELGRTLFAEGAYARLRAEKATTQKMAETIGALIPPRFSS